VPERVHVRAGSAVLLLAVALLATPSAQRRDAQPPPLPPATTLPDILAAARAQGTVRVIVRLALGAQPEAALPAPGVLSQRQAIARTGASLMARLRRAADRHARLFTIIPYLALEVDESELQALILSPEVAGVQFDTLARPTLSVSTQLIQSAPNGGDTGSGWSLAIVDTGVDAGHPFLAGRVVSEACYSSNLCPGGGTASLHPGSAAPCAYQSCEHGTHVAGIGAGSGPSFSGVAPGASVIAIQVFSAFTSSDICGSDAVPCIRSFTSDQIQALERVYELRHAYQIAAVNLSLGGALHAQPCDSDPRKAIVDELRAAGIATVVASGNSGASTQMASPACISTAISVGSSTTSAFGLQPDVLSTFTNRNAWLTLLAPGQWITSSVPGGGFATTAGTSMAAPHVTAALALLRGRAPSLSVPEAIATLTGTGSPIFDPPTGLTFPRLNVRAALATLSPPCDYEISTWRLTSPGSGGLREVTVSAPAGCGWTVSSSVPWITIQHGAPGQGPGAVMLRIWPNPERARRSATILVAGAAVEVAQRGSGPDGDITGNGRADLVWRHAANGGIALWQMDGRQVTGTIWFSIPLVADQEWRVAGSGDLDGDGQADLVWQHTVSGRLATWLLHGPEVVATLPLSIDRVTDLDWIVRAVGDVDGDGFADLVWQHRVNGALAVWFMNGAQVIGTQSLSIPQVADLQWHIAGAGDVDGDGKADLLWHHQTTGRLAVWLLDGAQVVNTVPLSVPAVADVNWKVRGLGDLNGDGRADLVWQNQATGGLGTWYLQGATVGDQWRLSIDTVSDLSWTVVGPG
jgi:subtilisin family serine protease